MKYLKWLAAVALIVVGFFIGRALSPAPGPPPPALPPDVIPVEVVKEIPVPGPERVVERVKWRTKTVEVPKEVIKQVVAQAESSGLPVEGKIDVLAEKYLGTDGDTVRFGWKGTADCKIRAGSAEWTTIVSEPFDLADSAVVTTMAPAPETQKLNRMEFLMGATPTSSGLSYAVGYWRHLSWRSGLGRKILPESIGAQVVVTPNDTAVLGGVAWAF